MIMPHPIYQQMIVEMIHPFRSILSIRRRYQRRDTPPVSLCCILVENIFNQHICTWLCIQNLYNRIYLLCLYNSSLHNLIIHYNYLYCCHKTKVKLYIVQTPSVVYQQKISEMVYPFRPPLLYISRRYQRWYTLSDPSVVYQQNISEMVYPFRPPLLYISRRYQRCYTPSDPLCCILVEEISVMVYPFRPPSGTHQQLMSVNPRANRPNDVMMRLIRKQGLCHLFLQFRLVTTSCNITMATVRC